MQLAYCYIPVHFDWTKADMDLKLSCKSDDTRWSLHIYGKLQICDDGLNWIYIWLFWYLCWPEMKNQNWVILTLSCVSAGFIIDISIGYCMKSLIVLMVTTYHVGSTILIWMSYWLITCYPTCCTAAASIVLSSIGAAGRAPQCHKSREC
jgi:hypothetical protein